MVKTTSSDDAVIRRGGSPQKMFKTQKKIKFSKKNVSLFKFSIQEKDWLLRDWNKDFELFNGITANIGQYLKDNDIEV